MNWSLISALTHTQTHVHGREKLTMFRRYCFTFILLVCFGPSLITPQTFFIRFRFRWTLSCTLQPGPRPGYRETYNYVNSLDQSSSKISLARSFCAPLHCTVGRSVCIQSRLFLTAQTSFREYYCKVHFHSTCRTFSRFLTDFFMHNSFRFLCFSFIRLLILN